MRFLVMLAKVLTYFEFLGLLLFIIKNIQIYLFFKIIAFGYLICL